MEADVIPRSEGTFSAYTFFDALSVCVFLCVTYLFYSIVYCYVSTLTPLYVRPLNQQHTNYNYSHMNSRYPLEELDAMHGVDGRYGALEYLVQKDRPLLFKSKRLVELIDRKWYVRFVIDT